MGGSSEPKRKKKELGLGRRAVTSVLVPLHPMEQGAGLEVSIFSAESLRFPTGTIGKNAFVVVGTDSCNRRATSVDHRGGAYPSWNEKFMLPFPQQVRSIEVDVRCQTALGQKSVGRSTIAVSEFVGVYDIPCGHSHFLSYRLHDKEGKRNGIINLAVKVLTLLPQMRSRPCAPLFPVPATGASEGALVGIAIPYAQTKLPSHT